MSNENLPAIRHTVTEIRDMAKAVAQSRLFGMDEAQLMTLMLLAQAKGIHPIQAVERYHVISGRPAMKADAMLADFMSAGGKVTWKEHSHTRCEATFSAPSLESPVTVAWTIEDARKAQLTGNKMYDKYPRQMLRSRVISEGIRMAMPGIVAGIYTPEEVQDISPSPASVRATYVEAKPTLPPPDNNSGYGRGQYAAPDQVDTYRAHVRQFVDTRNAEWLDEWQEPDGSLTEGIGDLLRTFQLTAHMLKFALRTGRLADVGMTFDAETGKPVEAVSVSKAEKYVAVFFARDRVAFDTEVERYAAEQSDLARKEWQEKYGESEGEGEDATADDIETTEAGSRL